jgi:hypothetical protein
MCMDNFNAPVSVRLVLGRHTILSVPKASEAGQREAAVRGEGVALRMALPQELDFRLC